MAWDATAVVVVIGAIGTMLVTVIGSVFAGFMAYKAKTQSDENGHKSDALIQKTDAIHVLTNSNLSKVQAALDTANARIAGLERSMGLMIEAKGIADKLIDRGLPATVQPVPVEVVNAPLLVEQKAQEKP